MVDLSKVTLKKKKDIINPLAIFSSLPGKSEKYNGYLRNVQGEVLNQWFESRDKKDNIIKMNTGSGKTTVALLILQSCLNEGKGNAIYVVRDNYLIKQVKEEASDLGINVVDNETNPEFIKNKAILVISIQKLINGKTVFDERNPIDNIIIDDVHACLDTAEQQFIIKISRVDHDELYKGIFTLFKGELQRQNHLNALNIEEGIKESNPMLVPFWEVKNKCKALIEIINRFKTDESYNNVFFPFYFLNDIIQYCNICISYDSIEISPDCFPIYKISSFNDAKRRIFISATLKDDGRLINCFNLNEKNIEKIITPSQALDIGNRMILYPQAINTNITDEQIKNCLKIISKKNRVVVIVPSYKRAVFWQDVCNNTFDKHNIEEIKNYHIGLDVLVNRYDGLDLKGDLCSYLVIDGLPNSKSLFNQIQEILLRDTSKSTIEKMQKIEQGMGRGIRSNQDDCAVVIMGKQLLNVIYNENSLESFSLSTKIQYQLSEQLSDQLDGDTLDNIMKTFDLCLSKNPEWLAIMNNALSEIKVSNCLNLKEEELLLNNAFNCALRSNYHECVDMIQEIVNSETNGKIKGYYMFYLAKYMNFIDGVESQKILLSAKKLNKDLCLPLDGYDYIPNKVGYALQSTKILELFKEKYKNNIQLYLFTCATISSSLIFSENSHKIFENAINDLAIHLGFDGSMPESEIGNGPDNIWEIGSNSYFVIECKNEAVSDTISKSDCGQMCVSENWAKEYYGNDKSFQSIIVHNSNIFDKSAAPNENFRIMTQKNLKDLTDSLMLFCQSIIKYDSLNEKIVSENLMKYHLDSKNILSKYTTQYERKR